MSDTRYTKQHEWVRVDGDIATVGISEYAQTQLGDVVFIDLPEIGRQVGQGQPIAVVESVKAASDVYAPVGGEVVEVNSVLADDPSKVNSGAETDGWFCRIRLGSPSEVDQLMDADAYRALVESLA